MALPVLPSFFHSHRSLRVSLKPPPASCAASPALPYVALLSSFLSLSRVHTNTRVHTCTYVRTYDVGVRIQVCTTRDSSTSSTIRRVRRSTPPRFNIQTICNNFAATITPSRAPCPTSRPILQHSCFLRLAISFSRSLALTILLLKPPSSASPSLSFISSSSPPLISPRPIPLFLPPSYPARPCFFHRTRRRGTYEHTHTETLRDCSTVWCTVPPPFHPATAITLNRRTGINI